MVEETVKVIREIEGQAAEIISTAEESGQDLISKAENDAETLKSKAVSDAGDSAGDLKKAAEARGEKAREMADKQIDREIQELAAKADSRKERAVSAVIQDLID